MGSKSRKPLVNSYKRSAFEQKEVENLCIYANDNFRQKKSKVDYVNMEMGYTENSGDVKPNCKKKILTIRELDIIVKLLRKLLLAKAQDAVSDEATVSSLMSDLNTVEEDIKLQNEIIRKSLQLSSKSKLSENITTDTKSKSSGNNNKKTSSKSSEKTQIDYSVVTMAIKQKGDLIILKNNIADELKHASRALIKSK